MITSLPPPRLCWCTASSTCPGTFVPPTCIVQTQCCCWSRSSWSPARCPACAAKSLSKPASLSSFSGLYSAPCTKFGCLDRSSSRSQEALWQSRFSWGLASAFVFAANLLSGLWKSCGFWCRELWLCWCCCCCFEWSSAAPRLICSNCSGCCWIRRRMRRKVSRLLTLLVF